MLAEKTVSLKRGTSVVTAPDGRAAPRGARATRALAFVLLLALSFPRVASLHDGNSSAFVTSAVGDTETAPRRSMVGFVQDCNGFPPRQSGTLCGARGAYLRGHYLWVAATQVDAVTVVDVYRPDMPTVAGSVSDPTRLKAVVAVWAHDSGEYVVAIARGVRPTGFGHVTIVDVRADRVWRKDTFGRYLAQPRVVAATRDCESRDGRSVGRLCGARALAVVGELAYVAAEMSNALSVMTLPGFLTVKDGSLNAGQDVPISAATPGFRGTVVDERLEGAYAVAVDSVSRFRTAYVASRFCKSCVVLVDVSDPDAPVIGGLLPRPDFPRSCTVPVMEETAVVATSEAQAACARRVRRADAAAGAATTKGAGGRVPHHGLTEESGGGGGCARASVARRVRAVLRRGREARAGVDSPPDEGYEYRRTRSPTPSGSRRLFIVLWGKTSF